MKISVAGENALIIYFGEEASEQIAAQVQQMTALLSDALEGVLVDLVPSYASLLVIYDALKTDHHHVRTTIRHQAAMLTGDAANSGRLVTLPVWYSEESGPDLQALAARARLSVEEVIDIHRNGEYRVYAIGFAPGFAYLGSVDERIAAPRLATPRQKVPRGAVAIADQQTAIYPAQSPGGWNLIGLSPQLMFNPGSEPHMPVAVGDRVRFEAISKEEFLSLGGELPGEIK